MQSSGRRRNVAGIFQIDALRFAQIIDQRAVCTGIDQPVDLRGREGVRRLGRTQVGHDHFSGNSPGRQILDVVVTEHTPMGDARVGGGIDLLGRQHLHIGGLFELRRRGGAGGNENSGEQRKKTVHARQPAPSAPAIKAESGGNRSSRRLVLCQPNQTPLGAQIVRRLCRRSRRCGCGSLPPPAR